jgi:hypothetical protein
MGDWRIFLKSRRNASFNEDLWNEPSLGWIHFAGQYLYGISVERGNKFTNIEQTIMSAPES